MIERTRQTNNRVTSTVERCAEHAAGMQGLIMGWQAAPDDPYRTDERLPVLANFALQFGLGAKLYQRGLQEIIEAELNTPDAAEQFGTLLATNELLAEYRHTERQSKWDIGILPRNKRKRANQIAKVTALHERYEEEFMTDIDARNIVVRALFTARSPFVEDAKLAFSTRRNQPLKEDEIETFDM